MNITSTSTGTTRSKSSISGGSSEPAAEEAGEEQMDADEGEPALDQTTQARSSMLSDLAATFDAATMTLDRRLRMVDTCLKLVRGYNVAEKRFVECVAAELPALLGLSCRQTGRVYLPFGGPNADVLVDAYLTSDRQVCCLAAEEISIKNPEWNEQLKKVVQKLATFFECNLPLEARLQNMFVLRKGFYFNFILNYADY